MVALERLWREKLTVAPPLPGWWPVSWERSLAVLGNPGMYRLRGQWLYAPWASSSVYDTAPLRDTLAELVDVDTLNNGDIQVIVGALEVATGEAKFFDNRQRALSFDDVVASGSLPPAFPMTEIDGDSYWDGGLFSNTPLSPAINFLEERQADDPSVCRELIVVELFPMRAPVPQTMPEVLKRMVHLQYTSRLNLDRTFFRKIDQLVDLFQAIDAQLPRAATSAGIPPTRTCGPTARSTVSTSSPPPSSPSWPTPQTSPPPPSMPASRPATTTPSPKASDPFQPAKST